MSIRNSILAAVALALAFGALAAPDCAIAQSAVPSQKQLDLAAARAQRKAIVGEAMQLTPEEARAFWPLYEQYEGQMNRIDDRHLRELKDFARHYRNLTEKDAARKLDEVIAIQQARLDTEKSFIPKFRAVLDQIKVTRFFQIDNKLHAMVQCQIAKMVPLAQSPGAAE
jgi:hypothetical protein